MKTRLQTNGGFGAIAVIGIIAVLALLGGGVYVATKSDVDLNADANATTTDDGVRANGWFNFDLRGEDDADVDANADVRVNTNTSGSGVNVNVGGSGSAQAAVHTVNYTANGFEPATVTINRGDTVRFVNKTNSGLWVASNDHPTHSILLGFDQKASVVLNGSYQFTFTSPGSWGFHNHLDSTAEGTVIVR